MMWAMSVETLLSRAEFSTSKWTSSFFALAHMFSQLPTNSGYENGTQ